LSRFSIALALYGLLGVLAWLTLPDPKIRALTLVLLGMFALRSWVHHRREALEKRDGSSS